MSTRSGKRIHASDQEIAEKLKSDAISKTERKKRSRRVKENDDLDVTIPKHKRNNYVTYPTDDEGIKEDLAEPSEVRVPRKLRRNTLKEQNIALIEEVVPIFDDKAGRQTRRTKRFAENVGDIQDVPVSVGKSEPVPNGKIKSKKNKKKKSKDNEVEQENKIKSPAVDTAPISKKSKKKKKGKNSNQSQNNEKQHNKSNTSIDSFHSAAGSPMSISLETNIVKETAPLQNISATLEKKDNIDKPQRKSRKSSTTNNVMENNIVKNLNTTFEVDDLQDKIVSSTQNVHNKRKSSIAYAVKEKNSSPKLNTTYEKEDENKIDKTLENEFKNGRKSIVNGVKENEHNVSLKLNTIFEKEDINISENKPKKGKKSSIANASLDVELNKPSNESNKDLNTTFEKTKNRTTRSTYDKPKPELLNSTFDKTETVSKEGSLNSTYDKETNKLDTTFDKIEGKSNSGKSSLITTDSTINTTFDKSNGSRISLSSDESKTENIINMTPVLIESSMDESMDIVKQDDTSKTNDSVKNEDKIVIPPLTREGTFTKDCPEVIFTKDCPEVIVSSAKPKLSINKTPTKQISLSSPGCTPFPYRSSQKTEKSILNVTRSIEKPTRRSMLAEVHPRQTRVMFCSPVNNPALVSQQKKTVIKSSMKGSSKSFVFEESGSTRPASRKRSLTLNDAEESRVKRKKLADDLQQSVDRLSRPRTSSASAKLDSTTPRKHITPKPKDKRTKLPNFAALHQRQFDKMESLDECQERKARRARQLLSPNGGVTVLERSSPRGTTESKTETKKPKKEPAKKPQEPLKSVTATPKLPTLDSLRPGYTRFGFKMHSDVNPFSFVSNTEIKPKENRLNGPKIIKPIKPLRPSLSGMTSRKEMAKQTVMREKSFTSLSSKREAKRTENRTVIKGVRTNRRFELQMKMRNID